MYERSKRKRGDHILMDSFWLCVRCVQKKEKEKEKTEAGRRELEDINKEDDSKRERCLSTFITKQVRV